MHEVQRNICETHHPYISSCHGRYSKHLFFVHDVVTWGLIIEQKPGMSFTALLQRHANNAIVTNLNSTQKELKELKKLKHRFRGVKTIIA